MFFVKTVYECVHIHECMREAAIVLVEQIPSNNGGPGRRARGRDESESSSKPNKGVDRLRRERELHFQLLKRKITRQKTR